MPSGWPACLVGRAPASAFAAYMRYAVKDRPVEQFDTDLQLPEWQLEPDDEYYYGEDSDYYYYIDENGNLIEPERSGGRSEPSYDELDPAGIGEDAPPAVNDSFLDRAINGVRPSRDRPEAPDQPAAAPSPPADRRYQQPAN